MADDRSKLSFISEIVVLLLIMSLFAFDAISAISGNRPVVTIIFKLGLSFFCLLRLIIDIVEYVKNEELISKYILNIVAPIFILSFFFIGIVLGAQQVEGKELTRYIVLACLAGLAIGVLSLNWIVKSWRSIKRMKSQGGE